LLAYKLICVWEEWFPARLICSIFGFIKKVQVEKEIAKPRYQGSLIQKQSQDSLLSRHRLSYSLFFFFFFGDRVLLGSLVGPRLSIRPG
jgi:hypothetical protein